MNKTICFLIVIITFSSCQEDDALNQKCRFQEINGIGDSSNSIIPLNSQNFWVYSDSLWTNGVFETKKSTLLKIDNVYNVDGFDAVRFSSILPLLTVKNDTLFATRFYSKNSEPDCYELICPMFFSTEEYIELGNGNLVGKYVYRSPEPVSTPSGIFSDNIIYNDNGVLDITVHEGVGIIKISFFNIDENGLQVKRRTMTLNDYDLQ